MYNEMQPQELPVESSSAALEHVDSANITVLVSDATGSLYDALYDPSTIWNEQTLYSLCDHSTMDVVRSVYSADSVGSDRPNNIETLVFSASLVFWVFLVVSVTAHSLSPSTRWWAPQRALIRIYRVEALRLSSFSVSFWIYSIHSVHRVHSHSMSRSPSIFHHYFPSVSERAFA